MQRTELIRGVGLGGAVATNAIAMIGIGPLITIPLVLTALHGPLSLAAWILGAIVAACDGLVWAELGAAIPGSGGLYTFFLRVFPPQTGRLLAFVYVWQFVLTTPFLLASGYIGFAQYATYLWPALRGNDAAQHAVAIAVGILAIALLSRKVERVTTIAIALFIAAIATLLIVTIAAWSTFDPHRAFTPAPDAGGFLPFVAGLGSGLVITLYDYLGYNTVTNFGDEVVEPKRTMPRSILIAIALIATLYLLLQTGILGAIPWQQVVAINDKQPDIARFLASTIVERAWGIGAAGATTILILITAFASTFALLFAASRVPYAAARDKLFFQIFEQLHKRDAYPYISLIVIGVLALFASLLPLDQIIAVIGVGIVVLGGVGAFAAVIRLRTSAIATPYRMPLYPLPPIIALAGWIYVTTTAGWLAVTFTIISLAVGAAIYALTLRKRAA